MTATSRGNANDYSVSRPEISGFPPLAAPWRRRGFSQLIASKKGVPRDRETPNSSNEIDTVLRGKVWMLGAIDYGEPVKS